MILLAILAIIAILTVGIIVAFVSIGGTVFLFVFGDLIVCVALIVFLIRFIIRRKRKK